MRAGLAGGPCCPGDTLKAAIAARLAGVTARWRLGRTTAADSCTPGAGMLVPPHSLRGLSMASTYETVAGIISDTCDIEPDKITPESHAINDLGIDSLDFLDVAFAIDKAFGIKMPLEQWTQDVNAGKVTTDEYFVLKNLCANIDKLVAAAKPA
jgi:acyl carrier protein